MSVGEAYPVEDLDDDDRPEALKSRQQLEDTEVDITPMIDITFLLLIFFLVASRMSQELALTKLFTQ